MFISKLAEEKEIFWSNILLFGFNCINWVECICDPQKIRLLKSLCPGWNGG